MDLPLVDQVREARRLAEEARDAVAHSRSIQVALSYVDAAATSADAGIDTEVPDDGLIAALSERWPQLADLAVAGPRPTQPLREQLRLRRLQFEAARQVLAPIVSDAARRGEAMAALQHEQHHLLEDPRYAEAVAELVALGAERDTVRAALTPLASRAPAFEICARVIGVFVDRLDWALENELPQPGVTAYRAGLTCHAALEALPSVLAQYKLDYQAPSLIAVPDAPDPAGAAELLAAVRRARDELHALRETFLAEHAPVAAELKRVQAQYDDLTQQIVDRMG